MALIKNEKEFLMIKLGYFNIFVIHQKLKNLFIKIIQLLFKNN